MSNKRWLYTSQGQPLPEPVEVSADYEPPVRTQINMDRHYVNTAATDGTDIGSRRKHREYMRANGLTLADDFKGVWAKASEQREKFKRGEHDTAARREAIARAIHTKGRR